MTNCDRGLSLGVTSELQRKADGRTALVVYLLGSSGIDIDHGERTANALLSDVNDVVALAREGYR